MKNAIILLFTLLLVFASFAFGEEEGEPAAGEVAEEPFQLALWSPLAIRSDDVGITNLSAYSRGMAGYHTPNIDRIANEGVLFTDTTPSKAARRAGPPSSPASRRSAPG